MTTTNSTKQRQVSETTTIGLLTTSNTVDQQPTSSDATRSQPNANNGVFLEPIPANLAVEYSDVSEMLSAPSSAMKEAHSSRNVIVSEDPIQDAARLDVTSTVPGGCFARLRAKVHALLLSSGGGNAVTHLQHSTNTSSDVHGDASLRQEVERLRAVVETLVAAKQMQDEQVEDLRGQLEVVHQETMGREEVDRLALVLRTLQSKVTAILDAADDSDSELASLYTKFDHLSKIAESLAVAKSMQDEQVHSLHGQLEVVRQKMQGLNQTKISLVKLQGTVLNLYEAVEDLYD